MINTIEIYVMLFFSYSILGWCMEVLVKFIQYKRFINRGFLIGPYCPIYGWGAILITLLLKKYINDPLVLFIFGMIICSILEYFTSWIMEKVFHARWWDYSAKKFNINGRICLNTLIPFGLLGVLIMYVLNPFFIKIYGTFNITVLTSICITLSIIFAIDNVMSITILSKFKKDALLLEKDNTEEMSAKVKKVLSEKSWGEKRLENAFPNLRHIRTVIKENVSKAKANVEEKQDKIKRETEEKILVLREEYNFKVKEIRKKAENKIKKANKKK